MCALVQASPILFSSVLRRKEKARPRFREQVVPESIGLAVFNHFAIGRSIRCAHNQELLYGVLLPESPVPFDALQPGVCERQRPAIIPLAVFGARAQLASDRRGQISITYLALFQFL